MKLTDKNRNEFIAKRQSEFKQAQGSRKNLDWKWFKYDLWVNGQHYTQYDKQTQQIVSVPMRKGEVALTINKIRPTLRAVRNFVLKDNPRAEVVPEDVNEESIEASIKLSKWLRWFHESQKLDRKLKGTLWNALKYIGFWQIVWDPDNQEIDVNEVDPYDLYVDPQSQSEEDCRYMILSVVRDVEYLKNSKIYNKNTQELQSDNKLSSSTLRAKLIEHERGAVTGETGTKVVNEHYYKVWENGQENVYVCTLCDEKIIREPELVGKHFPFIGLRSDIKPNAFYSSGWVADLIDPNKMVNKAVSSMAEYNDLINKIRLIEDLGAGSTLVNNQHGQIIRKKKGFDVTWLTPPPMSQLAQVQMENGVRFVEDLGAAQDAMLGRVPAGAKSGDAIEALQAGSANAISEVLTNTEEFLETAYERILEIASEKYQWSRKFITSNSVGQKEMVKVIGASAEQKPEDAVVIPPKVIVDVKLTPGIAHTEQGRRATLKELYQLQAIDLQTLLEGYSIGNVGEVLQRVKRERKQAEQGSNQPGANEAISVAKTIIQGQQPQVYPNVSDEFIQALDEIINRETDLPPEIITNLQQYREAVIQGMAQTQPQPGQPNQPRPQQ